MAIRLVNSIFYTGFSKDHPPRTIDLTDDPVIIETASAEIKNSQIIQVLLRSTEDFYITTAETSAEAITRLGAVSTRAYLPSGVWGFDISGLDDYIYIRSVDAATHAEAISLIFSERD